MNNVANFVKYQRKQLGLTQQELAFKAGVGVRFINELENGKTSIQIDKANQVLALFGYNLSPEKMYLDPYDIYWNFFNKAVKITLTNKLVKYGIILKEIVDSKSNKIVEWKFLSNNNAIKYHQKKDESLTEIIAHNQIQTIEEQ